MKVVPAFEQDIEGSRAFAAFFTTAHVKEGDELTMSYGSPPGEGDKASEYESYSCDCTETVCAGRVYLRLK